jgi:hypothetical protein
MARGNDFQAHGGLEALEKKNRSLIQAGLRKLWIRTRSPSLRVRRANHCANGATES